MAVLESSTELRELSRELHKMWRGAQGRLGRLDRYVHGDHDLPFTPPEANREYKALAAKATTNWMDLVVSTTAQEMYVDGYRRSGESENAEPWRWWQANRLDARQNAVHRGALKYGCAYVTVLPGKDPLTGLEAPAIRGVSPTEMVAAYEDPGDEWAYAAARVVSATDDEALLDVYDDENVYRVLWRRGEGDHADTVDRLSKSPHGLGVVPVVRFADLLDLEGRHPGVVEPLITLQDRINQTAFDTLMVQTFASYKVRTISGMVLTQDHDPDDENAAAYADAQARAAKIRVSQDRMLVAEDPDTKFGQLDETPLDGFISVIDQAVRHLAAISQTPPHHLLGQVANLSAEALEAAKSALSAKVDERKSQFGESWEQVLRLAARTAGDDVGAADVSAEVKWRDTSLRSLSAMGDALFKFAEIGVPQRGLWEMIPDVTQSTLDRWDQLASEGDALAELTSILRRQTTTEPADVG